MSFDEKNFKFLFEDVSPPSNSILALKRLTADLMDLRPLWPYDFIYSNLYHLMSLIFC
jgi:hypothetical protein